MANPVPLSSQLAILGRKLAQRAYTERLLDRYYEGQGPLPDVIIRAKVTRAYRLLLGMATAPWGSLVVDSVQDRLEITGLESDDETVDEALWNWYQEQGLDSESKLVHKSALISGRAYGLVWPDEDGNPEVTFDDSSQMVVRYEDGSRRKRVAAMRYWTDDTSSRPYANVYLPDGIYKFQGPVDSSGPEVEWEQRFVPDEDWPVANPFNVVPVVEFPVNRRLRPGPWAHARGEFEHVTSLMDRINLLTFIGLIVAFWQGFPIRAIIGDRILRDDENNPIPPFEVASDQIVQIENPEAKLATFDPADRSNLSIYAELDQLAALTKTPITYFPSSGSIANISADTIRALEGGLVAKIPQHHATLGEAWEEVLRLAGLMMPEPLELSPRAAITWADHENRSLSERADAAVKLSTILPQNALMSYVLNLTQEQIAQFAAENASSTLGDLLKVAATQPQPTLPPGNPAATNGGPPATTPAPNIGANA